MHQTKRVRSFLAQPSSYIRAFLLCFLLLGSQLSVFAGFLASANATGYSHGNGIIHSAVNASAGGSVTNLHTGAGVGVSVADARARAAAVNAQIEKIRQLAGKANLKASLQVGKVNHLAGKMSQKTGKVTRPLGKMKSHGVKKGLANDLGVSLAQSPASFTVGTAGTFTASITSAATATIESDAPTVAITLPSGFGGISAVSSPAGGWTIGVSGSVVSATYSGPPIPPGTTLPAIVVTTTPDASATNLSTVTATVSDADDANPADNTATLQAVIASTAPSVDTAISITDPNSIHSVGDAINYSVIVSSTAESSPITAGTSIDVTDLLPLGLTSVNVTGGSAWTVNSSATTSPSLITASYIGAYPIAAGTALPTINITGVVDVSAGTSYTSTASVAVPGDTNSNNDTSMFTFTINPNATGTGTAIGTGTATAIGTGTVTAIGTGTATAIGTGTATVTGTGTATTGTSPQLYLTKVHMGDATSFAIGQTITYVLSTSDLPGSASESQPITLVDTVPIGLTDIAATGNNWSVVQTGTTSPATVTLTYNGTYPVTAGTALPPVTISGALTSDAMPSFTNTATVDSSDDPNPAMNTSYDTITVQSNVATAPGNPPGNAPGNPPSGGSPCVGAVPPSAPSESGMPGAPSESDLPGTPSTLGIPGTPSTSGIPGTPSTSGIPVAPSASGIPVAPLAGGSPPQPPMPPKPPICVPDLQVITGAVHGDQYQVGDKVTFFVAVTNLSNADPVYDPTTISLEDVIPIGLHNIHVNGQDWHISTSDRNSPTVIDAQFQGSDPLLPNGTLPAITITGTLTNESVPTLTETATVSVPNETNTDNNTASFTICVTNPNNNNNHNNNHNNNTVIRVIGGVERGFIFHHNSSSSSSNNHQSHSFNTTPGMPLTGGDPFASVK